MMEVVRDGNVYYIDYGNGIYEVPRYVDLEGKPVERTREQYPYSYDAYVTFKDKSYDKMKARAVYSDRLFQWDSDKYNRCCKEVWGNHGQYFSAYDRNPNSIEKFLKLYFGKEIKLTAIMEGCNVSNGYPYWIFFYEDVEVGTDGK